MATIHTMTFNLRTDTPHDGINNFLLRTPRILSFLRREQPDLIGFQEATDLIRTWLRENLCHAYTLLGCGRGADYRGESTVLAFRTDRFEMIEARTLWLSPTPQIPASTYGRDQSECPRIVTMARLKHVATERPFWFINTHFDHVGSAARLKEAAQLTALIDSLEEPFILTGDFNALPDSPEIRAICEHTGCPIRDVTADIGGTFHAFGTRADTCKIDYIFTNAAHTAKNVRLVEDAGEGGVYLSDHYPVMADIQLP